jgi:hypothetical protein
LEPTISQSTAAKAGPEDAALQRHWTIQTDYGGLKSFLSGFSLNSRQALQYNFTATTLFSFQHNQISKGKKKKKELYLYTHAATCNKHPENLDYSIQTGDNKLCSYIYVL